MKKNMHYKHLSFNDRLKIQDTVNKGFTFSCPKNVKPSMKEYKKLVWYTEFDGLVKLLKKPRITVIRELIRGSQPVEVKDGKQFYTYSAEYSQNTRNQKYKVRRIDVTKISANKKLQQFILDNLNKSLSLKTIATKSKEAYKKHLIECPISAPTLYSYVDSEKVDCIDKNYLKRKAYKKHHQTSRQEIVYRSNTNKTN